MITNLSKSNLTSALWFGGQSTNLKPIELVLERNFYVPGSIVMWAEWHSRSCSSSSSRIMRGFSTLDFTYVVKAKVRNLRHLHFRYCNNHRIDKNRVRENIKHEFIHQLNAMTNIYSNTLQESTKREIGLCDEDRTDT